jgi:hypothetical protein
MKRTALSHLGMAVLSLIGLAGCGPSGGAGNRAAVTGQVTLDGKPLAQGAIKFAPMDQTQGVVTGANIHDGHFELPAETGAAVGWNRVEITGMRKSGKKAQDPFGPPGQMIEMETSAVAPRFNVSSILKIEIKPGENTAPFAVESK